MSATGKSQQGSEFPETDVISGLSGMIGVSDHCGAGETFGTDASQAKLNRSISKVAVRKTDHGLLEMVDGVPSQPE